MNFNYGPQAMASTQPTHLSQINATPPPAVPSIFGGQRPLEPTPVFTFSSMMNAAGPSGPTSEVGYDTNSKDPVMVRSRVFIGRISNVPVTREDLINLFKPFGTVLGLNYFKQGFAFVQFSSASEADAAVAGLNGKKWMGNIIDVHLVDPNAAKKRTDQQESTRKRGTDDEVHESQVLKISRDDSATLDDIRKQNGRNRTVALSDPTTNDDFVSSEMADTMICGVCRYVTADYEAFKDHRIAGCRSTKSMDEPKHLKCASCDSRFKSAWALLCHLTEFHRMKLYKTEEKIEEAQVKNHNSLSEIGLFPVSPDALPKEGPEKSASPATQPQYLFPRERTPTDGVQPAPLFGTTFPTSFVYHSNTEATWRQFPVAGSASSQAPVSGSNGSSSKAT